MKKLIIIPAYNEADNLIHLIDDIKKLGMDYQYVIINDGSKDNTKAICEEKKYNVINLPINSGIGVAVQTGYIYAYEYGYDIAVQVDGDGQHDVKYISVITNPIEKEKADIVIGSRYLECKGFQSSTARRFGIKILSHIIWICSGTKVKDVTSGFRAVNRKFIKIFSEDYSKDFPEPEAILTGSMYGGKIIEIPVIMKERMSGVSSINIRNSIYYMIKVTLAILIKRLSYGVRRDRGAKS